MIDLAKIDAIIAPQIKPNGPGCAAAIVRDGAVVHRKGYGLASIEWNIPIEPDTVFRIGSITKQFTAVAVMMLAEQGELSPDDLITKHLPDYPTSGHDVTIHHLLTHTSGIRNYTAIPGFMGQQSRHDMTGADICRLLSREPFGFRPGARSSYSNGGYFLLGLIVEKASGMSYADFVEQQIFAPLGMKQSYYMHNERLIPKRASGYDAAENGFVNTGFLSMTIPYAAGALGSTVNDLARWDKSLREHTLLKAETLALMHSPKTLDDGTPLTYGYGWGMGSYRGHRIVYHPGDINGFTANMFHFFDDGLAIILLSNLRTFNTGKPIMDMARVALGLPDIERKPVTVSEAALDRCAGTYLIYGSYPVEVTKSDGGLVLHIESPMKLLPVSDSVYYAADDPEVEIQFEDERSGVFSRFEVAPPLHPYAGTRV